MFAGSMIVTAPRPTHLRRHAVLVGLHDRGGVLVDAEPEQCGDWETIISSRP